MKDIKKTVLQKYKLNEIVKINCDEYKDKYGTILSINSLYSGPIYTLEVHEPPYYIIELNENAINKINE